ncbi:HdeD family acid-resistance protein [Formicincola oecophyllae]|uniref:HdeD family acid-resistance protein n=1 Tax=Formicincola oecophyllae TaxID=2558361 RepID=A0A4Y6UAB6_9PROT|nr:HdeD family acid-resistance protein [Formicincola oecophyllae]QDH13321.1 HdeD family acid-resistance protein [Formicincola oecophyllae]
MTDTTENKKLPPQFPAQFESIVDIFPPQYIKPSWFIASGALMVVLGILAWVTSFWLTMGSVMILGAFMLVGGAVQLVQGFGHGGRGMPRWLNVLTGALIAIAGGLMCWHPVLGADVVTAFIAALLIFGGLMRFWYAFSVRGIPGWWWGLVSGLITLALGVVLWAWMPTASLIFIGTLISVELLFSGISAIFLGLNLRTTMEQFQAYAQTHNTSAAAPKAPTPNAAPGKPNAS